MELNLVPHSRNVFIIQSLLLLQVSLTIAGGCRNEEDEMRVNQLKEYAKKLGVEKNLEWKLNVPYGELYQLLNVSFTFFPILFPCLFLLSERSTQRRLPFRSI